MSVKNHSINNNSIKNNNIKNNNYKVYSLVSGSSGNSYIFISDNKAILIDAGLTLKKFKNSLLDLNLSDIKLSAIFITHEHSDHMSGAENIANAYNLPIYATAGTIAALNNKFKKGYKIKFVPLQPQGIVYIDDFRVKAFPLSHDAAEAVGFSISFADFNIAIISDTGYVLPVWHEYINNVKHDIMILEANYDEAMLINGSYPLNLKQRISGKYGHLSNTQAAEFIVASYLSGCKKIVLAHLSQNNNFPELALLTIKNQLLSEKIRIPDDIEIKFAARFEPTEIFADNFGEF